MTTHYPKNDLWSVRQIEFLEDALLGFEGKSAQYYPEKTAKLEIPGVETYTYTGVLYFPDSDRTIIFEQGPGYGLAYAEITQYLNKMHITFSEEK